MQTGCYHEGRHRAPCGVEQRAADFSVKLISNPPSQENKFEDSDSLVFFAKIITVAYFNLNLPWLLKRANTPGGDSFFQLD
jgi:hypothetical protein